jgi:hypothetical protein
MLFDRATRLAESILVNYPVIKNPVVRRAAYSVGGIAARQLRKKISAAPPVIRHDGPKPGKAGLDKRATVKAAQRLNHSSGILAASVLFDSGIEHYRGSFHNKAMFTPLIASTLSLLASGHGAADRSPGAHKARHLVFALAGATGLIGTAFHVHNVSEQPGGFSWQNLFYKAPLGAPAAIALSGLMGVLAERVRDTPRGQDPTLLGFTAGRFIGVATAVGLLGTTGEAGLLHFRGAFHNPVMYAPVTVPPVGAALLATAALGKADHPRPLTRSWLTLTSIMGVAGVGFHIYGVSRAMGGWRNWRQNMIDGPPIPAPPSFVGLALAGLAALGLLRDHPDN